MGEQLEKDLQIVSWKQYDRTPQTNVNANGWVDINSITYNEPKYEVVNTMGFKVKEDATWITLAQSIKNGMASIITTILKQDIISQTSLYKTPPTPSKPYDKTAYTNVIQNKIQKASNLTTSPISKSFTPQQITTVVKREVADDINVLDDYDKGLTWSELETKYNLSKQELAVIIKRGKENGLVTGRKEVVAKDCKKYSCQFRKPNNPLYYVYKGPYKGTFDVQWLIDNFEDVSHAEIMEHTHFGAKKVTTIVDYMIRKDILPNYKKIVEGKVCKSRNPFKAHGISKDEVHRMCSIGTTASSVAQTYHIGPVLAKKLINIVMKEKQEMQARRGLL